MMAHWPRAYTTAEVLVAVEEIERHLAPSAFTDEKHDGTECMAADVLATVAPAIAARALREAARDIWSAPAHPDQQRFEDACKWLACRADEIEANE